MMVHVKFHDIGEGIAEGEILKFFVQVGDQVKNDQPLVEVQTDKMTTELPSPAKGIVKEIKVREGENVVVGTTLLVIEPEEQKQIEKVQKNVKKKTTSSFHEQNNFVSRTTRKIVKAAPYTRRIARELGINIEEVKGTGPSGRVMEEDLYRHKNGDLCKEFKLKDVDDVQIKETIEETIPFRGRRKQIAAKMVKSVQTIPHVTHFDEIDVTNLLQLTKELKETGTHLSIAAFFIKVVQLSLQQSPIFNAVLDEKEELIRLNKQYHIGIAVDTKEGLVVPVIRDVEKKSIKQIHTEMKQLIERAKNNQLTVSEIRGGTFTVNNVGPLGSIAATPIINEPEVALITFHQAKKRPAVINDGIAIRSIMNMSLSFDHRVIDGASAIAFTNQIGEWIEQPEKMLIELT